MTDAPSNSQPIALTVTEARVIHWALCHDLGHLQFDQPEVKNMIRNIRDKLEEQLAHGAPQ